MKALSNSSTCFAGSEPEFSRRILATLPINVFLFEVSSNRALWWNNSLSKMLGYSEGVIELGLIDLFHPEDQDVLGLARKAIESNGDAQLEYRLRHADGTWRWFASHMVIFGWDRHGIPTQLLGILVDITESKAARERVEHDAAHDPLTDIANRRRFMAEVEARVLMNSGPLCLCICDIDHFKMINDNHGHAVGDEVLRTLAHLMRKLVRTDDMVARLGGDEFCLLLSEQTESSIFSVVDRIRCEINKQEFAGTSGPFLVTASFGIAEFERGTTPAEWLARADEALYRAKRGGRNCVL